MTYNGKGISLSVYFSKVIITNVKSLIGQVLRCYQPEFYLAAGMPDWRTARGRENKINGILTFPRILLSLIATVMVSVLKKTFLCRK
jgi:hypothetical protein